MTRSVEMFLALLRLSLNDTAADDHPEFAGADDKDWEDVFAISARQGTVMLAYGGLQHLPPAIQPPRKLKLRWCANVVKGSDRYDGYRLAIHKLSRFFSEHGFDFLILKGITMSRLYPVPYYREGGDIDVYMFDRAKQADRLVSSQGIDVTCSIAKHSAFMFEGRMVENHYTFFDTDIRFRREARFYTRMEEMLAGMFTVASCPVVPDAANARELPPQAAALYLIGHTFRHFCCMDANVRQLCDWVVFFGAHRDQIDNRLLEAQIEELGIGRFVSAVNALCAARFGFEPRFMIPGSGDENEARFILKTIMRYRVQPRVHIPMVMPLRYIVSRNSIYNRYFGKIGLSEFLRPELMSYFSYLMKRPERGEKSKTRRDPAA